MITNLFEKNFQEYQRIDRDITTMNKIKWNKKDWYHVENDLTDKVRSYIDLHSKTIRCSYMEAYKLYNQDDEERAEFLKKEKKDRKTNFSTDYIKSLVEAQHNALNEIKFRLKLKWKNKFHSDTNMEVAQAFWDFCMHEWIGYILKWEMAKEWFMQMWFGRVWMKYWPEKYLAIKKVIDNPEMNLEEIEYEIENNRTYLDYVDPRSLMFLPNQNFYKADKIYRNFEKIQDVIDRFPFISLSEEERWYIVKYGNPIDVRNYAAVKLSRFNFHKYWPQDLATLNYYETFKYSNDFVEVCEIWEHPNRLAVLLNWIKVYDGPSPLFLPWDPFIYVSNEVTPWVSWSSWVAATKWYIQTLTDQILCNFSDQVKLSVDPVYFIKGHVSEINWAMKKQIWSHEIIQLQWDWQINRFDFWQVNPSVLNVIDYLQWMWSKALSSRYFGGNNWGIERSARWADLLEKVWMKEITPMVLSMSIAVERMMDIFIQQGKHIFPNKFKIKVDKWLWTQETKSINMNKIQWPYDVFYLNENITTSDFNEWLTSMDQLVNMISKMNLDENWRPLVNNRYIMWLIMEQFTKQWILTINKDDAMLIEQEQQYQPQEGWETPPPESGNGSVADIQQLLQSFSPQWQTQQPQWIPIDDI